MELSLDEAKPVPVPDMQEALQKAKQDAKAYEENTSPLVTHECENCGRTYPAHPYSLKTKVQCPYCFKGNSHLLMSSRIDAASGGAYRLAEPFSGINTTMVECAACGAKHRILGNVLYWQTRCKDCKTLTPANLKRRFDPDETEWVFLKRPKGLIATKIAARHIPCGWSGALYMQQFTSKETGWCPVCDCSNPSIPFKDLVPGYRALSSPKNNHERFYLTHVKCGTTFGTSRAQLLAGHRCPVCYRRITYRDIATAIDKYAPGCTYERTRKGHLRIDLPSGNTVESITYQKAMEDLLSGCPRIFTWKTGTPPIPKSERRKIYDAVRKDSKKKGFWSPADGIAGKPITGTQRSILNKMVHAGLLTRVETGRYIV